jgi:nitroreductase
MMSYDEVVMGRRSIRGFKPDPVPLELIKEILTMAMRSPSLLRWKARTSPRCAWVCAWLTAAALMR